MISKKLGVFFLMGLIVLFSTMATAKEQLYDKSVNPTQFGSILKTMTKNGFWINYDDSTKQFIFYSNETMGPVAFYADTGFIDSMIKIIDKYVKWNTKASAKGIKLEKEISKLKTWKAYWKWGDEWYSSSPINISFSFFSQNKKEHQLVLVFGKMRSPHNEYLTHRPETLYFDYSEVIKLKKVLSKDNFKLFLKKVKKKKMIDDEFK